MKVVRQRRSVDHDLVAVSANGHRETVLRRRTTESLNKAELALLRALARRHGFQLVRPEEWSTMLESSARAHRGLSELRRELEDTES